MKLIILTAVIIFFAMNMGASGIAPAFAAAYGGKLIRRRTAFILFPVFVVIGALALGRNVSLTLGKGLIPPAYLNVDTVLIIMISSAACLFLANVLKIPQSTSQVTVGAIAGAGMHFQHLYSKALLAKILPAWVILPVLSFALTFVLFRGMYPPRPANLRVYEKILVHERKLTVVAVAVSCYVAFAIGSNNVANAVGPLSGAGIIGVLPGLLSIAPIFGVGALCMGKGTLETAGKGIVPLGVFTGTLVSFVTATLLIAASIIGIPQSLVQLNVFALLAVSCLKNGHRSTLDMHVTKKTFVVWAITPVFSMVMTYCLLYLFNTSR